MPDEITLVTSSISFGVMEDSVSWPDIICRKSNRTRQWWIFDIVGFFQLTHTLKNIHPSNRVGEKQQYFIIAKLLEPKACVRLVSNFYRDHFFGGRPPVCVEQSPLSCLSNSSIVVAPQ